MNHLNAATRTASTLLALAACVVLGQQQPTPPPYSPSHMAKLRAEATAPVYSHVYEVPAEITSGKGQEWLAAYEKSVDGIPPSMRHKQKLRDVFSASVAVRASGLDTAVWGKRLYGDDTVARKVFDALARVYAGDVKALPALIDAVPGDEKVGGGWRYMGLGLHDARGSLGAAFPLQSIYTVSFAGVPFPAMLPPDEARAMRARRPWNPLMGPDDMHKPIADTILNAEGGTAWKEYRVAIERFVGGGATFSMVRTPSMARLVLALCDDPKRKSQMANALRNLVPDAAEKAKKELDQHTLTTTGDPKAAMRVGDDKRQSGEYEEALALYRQAEATLPNESKSIAWSKVYSLLSEASAKGQTLSATWETELASRKAAAAAGGPQERLAYASALLGSGQKTEALALVRQLASSSASPTHVRIQACSLCGTIDWGEAWTLAKQMPDVYAEDRAHTAEGVCHLGTALGEFAETAQWLGAIQEKAPDVRLQAREALLWCAAGDAERGEARLVVSPKNPQESLSILGLVGQLNANWANYSKVDVYAASDKAFKKAYPPGSSWPMSVRYAMRIMDNRALRREKELTRAWTYVMQNAPAEASDETRDLAGQLNSRVVAWAEECLPAANSLLSEAGMIFNGRPKGDTLRVEAGRTVVIGAIRVLAKRGVPTNTVETAAYWLCRPDFKDRLPAEDLRAIRLAVSEAYPDLLAKIPEPEAKP